MLTKSKHFPNYVKYMAHLNVYAYHKRRLKGVAFNIAYGDAGDVLATDTKRGLWYYTLGGNTKSYYYGPFKSAQAARRGYDKHVQK